MLGKVNNMKGEIHNRNECRFFAVVPAHHILDNPVRKAVGFEQLEHLLPEQRFQIGRAGLIGLLELALTIKAAVRGDDVKMRIEILEVAERLHRHHAAGYGLVIRKREPFWKHYLAAWEQFRFFDLCVGADEPVFRAYSLANPPYEKDLRFTIRIATPPPGREDLPPPWVHPQFLCVLRVFA